MCCLCCCAIEDICCCEVSSDPPGPSSRAGHLSLEAARACNHRGDSLAAPPRTRADVRCTCWDQIDDICC